MVSTQRARRKRQQGLDISLVYKFCRILSANGSEPMHAWAVMILEGVDNLSQFFSNKRLDFSLT